MALLCLLVACDNKQPGPATSGGSSAGTSSGATTHVPRGQGGNTAAGTQTYDEASYNAELAQVHLRFGKTDLAVQGFLKAIEQAKTSSAKAQYHYQLAQASIQMGDEAAAESNFLQAVKLSEDPESRRSYMQNLAQNYARLGKGVKAEEYYTLLIKEAKDKGQRREYQRQLLQALNMQNKLDKAAADFEARLKKNPDDEEALLALFDIHYALKRNAPEAIAVAILLLDREPANETWLQTLANLYEETGKHKELIKTCEALIARNPSDTGRRMQHEQTIARAWARAGEPQKAISIMQALVAETKDPNQRQMLESGLMSLYNETGLMGKYVGELEEKLVAAPGDVELTEKLLSIYTSYKQDPKRAMELCEMLIKVRPEDRGLLSRLAQLQVQNGEPRRAIATMEKLGKLEPAGKQQYDEQIANLYVSLKEVDKAVAIYAQMAETASGPARATLYQKIANLCATGDKQADADKWILKMLDAAPNDPQFLMGASDFYGARGNQTKSIEFVRKAAEAAPDPAAKASYRFRLAGLLEQNGKSDDAEAVLRQVMKEATSPDIVNQAKGLLIDLCRRTGKLDRINVEGGK
ncbi:MAG: tetratricopeptide repeat protein [Planctomycetota bacterium]|nr:tetratricopeptide repeat protein [Planctomycetota bacterium]